MTGRFGHGLVIGKFYPPHRGHLHLIESAAAGCERLSVLVMAARGETLPLPSRVAWLRSAVAGRMDRTACGPVTVGGVACDVPVDYGDPHVWTAQVAVMRAALDRDRRPPVDAVHSSEPYGAELAAHFGGAHVAVDPGREAVPVSASQVRADLFGHWDQLVPAARAGLAVRAVVVGAESTGTTTVAGRLAGHYRARGGAWAGTPSVAE